MQLRGSARLVAYALICLFAVYIPLNVVYVLLTNSSHHLPKELASGVGSSSDISLSIKEIVPHQDGTVDLVLNFNIHDLMNAVDNPKVENYKGEETQNPLPSNFTWVLNRPDYCSKGYPPRWIIYVHTAPGNEDRRRLLRETWANNNLFKDGRTKTIFLVGTPDNNKDQTIIEKEYAEYKDIVQGSFMESYKNLTIKGIMGLRWVSEFCPQAKFALKADDDAYVNLFKIMPEVSESKDKKILACPLWKDNTMPILRDPKKCMKWCVKYSEFPGRTHFPEYCAGLAFVLSASIVPEMYEYSKSTPFFWIDDVYVTGLLAGKVKDLKHHDYLKHFTLKEDLANSDYTSNKTRLQYYFSHVKKRSNFERIWNSTLDRLDVETLKQINNKVIQQYPHLVKRIAG